METITKHIGEGFARGELYAALAYDSTDQFGGKAVKQIRFNPASGSSAITVGTYGSEFSTATDGIKMIVCECNYTKSSGIWRGLYIVGHATATTGTEQLEGIMGYAGLDASKTLTGGRLTGICGRVRVSGTLNGSGVMVSGVTAQINDGGAYTAVSHIASLWADNQLAKTVTGQHDLIYMTNNGGSSSDVDQAMFVYGPYVTNLIRLDTCTVGGMVSAASASALHGTLSKKIKISIDGVTYYLLASTTPT